MTSRIESSFVTQSSSTTQDTGSCRRRIRRRSARCLRSLPLVLAVSVLYSTRCYHCCRAISITSPLRNMIPSLFSRSSNKRTFNTKRQETVVIPREINGNVLDDTRTSTLSSVTTRISNLHHHRQHQQQRSTNNRLFVPSPLFATPNPYTNTLTSNIPNANRKQNQQRQRSRFFQTRRQERQSSSSSLRTASSTALRMVLTTPESIIEQASTMKLLDDLIDESVRTTARRPFILQFDPSSGYVSALFRGISLFVCLSYLDSLTTYTLRYLSFFPSFLVSIYSFGDNGRARFFL